MEKKKGKSVPPITPINDKLESIQVSLGERRKIMSKKEGIIVLKNNRRLAYTQYGNIYGKPIFFFHGWPSSRKAAAKYEMLLRKFNIRLIAPDRPGYGLSDFQENRTILNWTDDIKTLADRLFIKKFAVMGVSGGGPYAAACACNIPNRITKTGIVVGLGPIVDKLSTDGMMWVAKIGWTNFNKYPVLRRLGAFLQYINSRVGYTFGLQHFFFGAKADGLVYRDPSVKASVLESCREAFRQGFEGPAWDLKLYSDNWGFDIGKIRTKTYLWYGEDDRNVTLAMARYYHKKIKGSTLTIYPGEGHLISVTHASEILQTLIS